MLGKDPERTPDGQPTQDDWIAGLKEWGFCPPDDAQSDCGPNRNSEDVCEVFSENISAFRLFCSCMRYWQLVLGGMGGAQWRAACPSDIHLVMKWQGASKKQRPKLFEQYALMEQEALRLMNEREAEGAKKAAG